MVGTVSQPTSEGTGQEGQRGYDENGRGKGGWDGDLRVREEGVGERSETLSSESVKSFLSE